MLIANFACLSITLMTPSIFWWLLAKSPVPFVNQEMGCDKTEHSEDKIRYGWAAPFESKEEEEGTLGRARIFPLTGGGQGRHIQYFYKFLQK